MKRIIKKKELLKIFDSLSKDFEVIGPRELAGKGVFYEPEINSGDLYLESAFAIEPIKKFFLQPSECLSQAKFQQAKVSLEEAPLPERKRIIFGLRPCEARGLTLLDKVFNSDYQDKFYINNRQRSLIVGLACAMPDKSCFCVSMDGSPVESSGMDVLLFNLAENFILEICTDKGREIFGSLGQELNEVQKNSLETYKQKTLALVQKKLKVPDDLAPVFESPYWDKVCLSCLSCGICTYLCPTCHCFDLVDQRRRKLRCYDGCAFTDFTLEASGVNPRPTNKERYRQRVFHKFDYFKINFGEHLCVGCGRCIRHCPVKMDIADIVNKIPVNNSQ